MEYSIIYILSDHSQHMTETFSLYQNAKRFAKELSKRANVLTVWIEGYEKIKNEDLDF